MGYYHDYQGRYLLGHRYFDAYTGRFVTRDPIGYKGGINLYGFVGNNPVNESDPDGISRLRGPVPALKKFNPLILRHKTNPKLNTLWHTLSF